MNVLPYNKTGSGILLEYDAGYVSPKDNANFITELKENIKTKSFDFSNPVVKGVMQKYGVENKNGRVYPEDILRREVIEYMKLVKMGASAGESDHPSSAVISIQTTSMRITNLWWEGRTLMGDIYLPITRGYIEMVIISHPADKLAHDMIHGFRYGVSSRGVGSVTEVDGKNIVQDDFELVCWDFVTTPSTHGSWVSTDKKDLQQYIESAEPSKFELNDSGNSFENTEREYFNSKNKNKQASVESALSHFMKGFK